ncbi:MAG: hypothetical protein VX951_03905 [Planctomycetota bacterium]|nr:hypothetical protein [Planctomycetota bacterium]
MRIPPLIILFASFGSIAAVCPAQSITEQEYNENAGYANDLGTLSATKTMTGYVNGPQDVDTFRFKATADGLLRITTSYNGSALDLVITNAHGDENWGMHRFAADRVVLPVPKGVYHVRLGGSAAVTRYSMSLELQAQTLPTLALGRTTQLAVGPQYGGLRIVQPQDGRLQLDFTTSNSADSFLVLQNSQWGYVYEVDDASTSTSEPGLDAVLPKGTYYLYVGADVAATTSIRSAFTSLSISELKTTASGTIGSQGPSFELHKIELKSVEEVQIAIAPRGSTGITDSYLQLFDRNMVQVLESDDDSVSTLSSIAVTLPVGIYYVASTGYYDRGDYLISKSSGAAVIDPVRAGSNFLTAAADRATTMRFRLETPAGVEFNIVGGPGYDAQVSVLDAATGLSFAWEDDESLGSHDCNLGMRLPEGDYFVIAKNYDGASGVFEAQVVPPLQRWVSDHVRVRMHGGQLAYFLVSLRLAAPSNPLPGILTGKLLVDLSVAVPIVMTIPWHGTVDFQAPLLPNSGVYLQMVAIDLAGPTGEYSNLLK